jgi:hypothetical protein
MLWAGPLCGTPRGTGTRSLAQLQSPESALLSPPVFAVLKMATNRLWQLAMAPVLRKLGPPPSRPG